MTNDDLPSLDSLKQKIDAQASGEESSPSAKEKASRSRTAGLAMRMGIDLVSAIGVSIVLGVFLDKQFETTPLFFITLFCLGCVAGFRMMMQTNARAQAEMKRTNVLSGK
jgi:F0F1-type ATP synthase assembly protein I